MTIITLFYLMTIPSFVYRKFIDYKMAAKNKYKRGMRHRNNNYPNLLYTRQVSRYILPLLNI